MMGLRRLSLLQVITLALGAGLAALTAAPQQAAAVPSFARQTGLACEACHTVFPELTPFGRRFKLNAYTLTTKPQISDINAQRESSLSLADLPPISLMFQASSTWQGKSQTDTGAPGQAHAQNGTVEFPQQLSFFYGGKIADHFGALFQVTYTQPDNHFSIDNSDIRYANQIGNTPFLFGVTANNNPTVQDVWNSTPAWGLPSMTPPVGLTPTQPLISQLGGQVAGVGAYAMYKDSFYLEGSVYRPAPSGVQQPLDSTSGAHANNYAPYWRAAYEYDKGAHSFEVGTFGMHANYTQGGLAVVGDAYTDVAVDTQYQYIGDDNIFTVSGSIIHEYEDWQGRLQSGSVSNPHDSLNQYKLTGSYYYQRKYGANVTFTKLTGSSDALLYAPAMESGSGNGNPGSQWETLEVDYLPFLNTKLFLQYTIYQKFNGSTGAYDGVSNRQASDNNTFMLGMWTNF